MSTDMLEIPYVFTAAWIGLLGAYLLWMSQCTHVRKGTPDMISWMFERCNRRYEDATQAGDTVRAHAYNQRRALLADFMNFIGAANDSERDQATEMLNTIDDISSHENSPTKDMNEGEDNRSH